MKALLLLCGILIVGAPARATPDGVTLVGGGLSGTWTLFHDPSPSPTCGIGWDASLGEGEFYHSEDADPAEPCRSRWLVHCSADSMSYRGAWSSDDPTDFLWNFSFVQLEVSVSLVFDGPARIFVASESRGVLQADSHLVLVSPHGGPAEPLLGPTPGGVAALDVPAGAYDITLGIDVIEHHTHYPYAANLRVWWEVDPGVPTRTATWAGVKALYR